MCVYVFCLYIQSESLREAIYFSGWEKTCDKGTRSTLLIILVRASRPVVLKTMFRDICLDALTDVSILSQCVIINPYTFVLRKVLLQRKISRHSPPH